MEIKEIFYNIIFYPSLAFNKLKEIKKYGGLIFLSALVAFILNELSYAIAIKKLAVLKLKLSYFLLPLLLNFIINLVILSAILYFLRLVLIKEETSARETGMLIFKVVCISYLPFYFLPVLSLINISLFGGSKTIFLLLRILVYLWTAYLQFLGFSIITGIDKLRAIIVYILSLMFMFFFFELNIVSSITNLIALLI